MIYTPGNNGDGTGRVTFDTGNTALTTPASSPLGNPTATPSTFDPCLQGLTPTATLQNLINYVRGTDINKYCSNGSTFNSQACTQNSDCTSAPYTLCLSTCRNRTIGLCSDGSGGLTNISCVLSGDCPGSTNCVQNAWKLGDIVYSTPKVEAAYKYCATPDGSSFSSQACSMPAGNFCFSGLGVSNSQTCWQDSDCRTYPFNSCHPECDTGNFTSCASKESVVFVGANDGMLHAFQTGILTTQGLPSSTSSSTHQIETLTGIPPSSMGQELWAFIPKNSLPYLRCLAAPPPSSCHLYYNDLSPYITSMVSNGVTKTVLIGGMRLGGGSIANYCYDSSGTTNGQLCSQKSDCASDPYTHSCSSGYNVPQDTCGSVSCSDSGAGYSTSYNPSSCTGLSSYYALDITIADQPKLLWEFSHPFLGYTYSGPAVIHKWADVSSRSGDQYYVMFLSGPTDPVDGSSMQDAQAFVLKLNANLGIGSVYYKDFGNTTKNGFGGRLFTNGLDVDGDGYTDYVFFGYSSSPNGQTGSWQGGIGVVNTNNTDPSAALDPASWTWDVSTYANIAQLPITSQVATMQCFTNPLTGQPANYLFAGTGRYFFPQDNYGSSGNSGLNYLMGIPFTCDQYYTKASCGSPNINSLNKNSTACSALTSAKNNNNLSSAGWQYNLDPAAADGTYLAERMITNPLVTPPGFNKVYFVTSEPTSVSVRLRRPQSRVGLQLRHGGRDLGYYMPWLRG